MNKNIDSFHMISSSSLSGKQIILCHLFQFLIIIYQFHLVLLKYPNEDLSIFFVSGLLGTNPSKSPATKILLGFSDVCLSIYAMPPRSWILQLTFENDVFEFGSISSAFMEQYIKNDSFLCSLNDASVFLFSCLLMTMYTVSFVKMNEESKETDTM